MVKIVHMAHMNVSLICFIFTVKINNSVLILWNPWIWKYKNQETMESSKEIHETMNLKTRMCKKKKNPWAVWDLLGSHIWSTVSILIFWKFKVDYAYCPNLNLKSDFLAYEIVNVKIKIVTSLWKVNLDANELMNTKRHSHEIMNMKTNFLWNLEYETGNAMTSWIWNQNFCKTVNWKWHLMKCKLWNIGLAH